jgi:DNA-binding CsgD family transcriptional regulator
LAVNSAPPRPNAPHTETEPMQERQHRMKQRHSGGVDTEQGRHCFAEHCPRERASGLPRAIARGVWPRPWQLRTNVWRKVTSPGNGAPRQRSGSCNVPSRTVVDLIMHESINRLRSHFGLSPAEAKLALHLVAGGTLRSAATKFDISYQTARTHLKTIFKKTGACRQAELVTIILTALPDSLT